MTYKILTVLLFIPNVAIPSAQIEEIKRQEYTIQGVKCVEHPIFCQIKTNNPKIGTKYAMMLSNWIYKSAKKYNVDQRVYTAMLAQESRYEFGAVNCTTGLKKPDPGKVYPAIYPLYVYGGVCTDFGVSQIHWKTVVRYNLDHEKLIFDTEYAVEAGARVLGDFKKMYGNKEPDYWTRYNASTPEKRGAYKKLVERFM